jgi:GT2 family glycosyltransferase
MPAVAVLITAHNRKAKTLACLESVFAQEGLPPDLLIQIFLVDDGCTDGTSQAVNENFPQVRLVQGTGSLYWNGGMYLAFGEALKENFDYFLWLNDDTQLFSTALANMLATSKRLGENAIVVGSTRDRDTGQLTYGGVRRFHRGRPLKFTSVLPGEVPVEVETMNGNCVLIPKEGAHKVGNLDPRFTHGIGDFDYGLRARKLGIEIYIAPSYYGYCQRNENGGSRLPFRARWKKLLSPLGLPPREWAIFAKRYAGPFWYVFFASPYLNDLFKNRQR